VLFTVSCLLVFALIAVSCYEVQAWNWTLKTLSARVNAALPLADARLLHLAAPLNKQLRAVSAANSWTAVSQR
jgi:hypothetical protein